MADAVASQTLADSSGRLIAKFTNVSDGTGESAVTKVDISTFGGMSSTSRCTIERIQYTNDGMALRVLWGADTDVVAWALPNSGAGDIVFPGGGLTNNAGTNVTGDIKFTTVGHTSGDTYSVILYLRKIV